MPDTFQAVAVIAVALLPGALYIWSFERLVGAWGVGLSDRVLRFVGVSAVLHAVVAPVTYGLWSDYIASGRLARGEAPLALWTVPIVYVGVPILAGSIVGIGTRRSNRWARIFTGPSPAPRAWDQLFGSRPDGWIRLRLKSGTWLGGAYAREGETRSYAAGYPHAQDLYLAEAAEIDPQTGRFVFDDRGRPVLRGSGILLRWEEVEYLEFIEG